MRKLNTNKFMSVVVKVALVVAFVVIVGMVGHSDLVEESTLVQVDYANGTTSIVRGVE